MREKKNLHIQVIVLLVGTGLMLIKFGAWWISNSNAILTDAVESIVNVIAAGIGVYALYLSSLPRDKNHPYGHGKAEFLSAGVEGSLVLTAGVIMIVKSVYGFTEERELGAVDYGLYIVIFAGVVNLIMGLILKKRGKKVNSLALESSGNHLLSDVYSTIGLVVGLILLYFFPYTWIDNALAIIFGGIIAFSGFKIVRKSVAGIMDEADEQLINELVRHLNRNRKPEWIDIHNFRVVKYGAMLHIDSHLTLPYYFDVERMHDEVEQVNKVVNDFAGEKVEMFIHVDPCIEEACAYCLIEDCPVRKHAFKEKIDWNYSNVIKNQKHAYQKS
ncbi:cation diffusion facilitator family transporter [Salibacter sp.]|uniref:cation diffusion facilitator family transporter n=1 Tax=Salibacter sp. TaxID=2010995 RepID=UPI002870309D|nr:cation diffusion facilitator family transporter [Salibacter sp.]MDR9486917.1 cation diffusion facilitator family transporter [Salibacter sp.]